MSDYRRDRDRKDRDYDRDNKRKRDDRDDRDRDRDRERDRDRDRDRDDRRDRRDRDSSSKRKRDDRSKSPEDDRRRGSERDGSHSETPKESRRSEEREMKTDSNGKKDVKKTPMDVEDLIKKKQEEENKSKPVFLSKEERAKLALARRAAEVEEKMKKLEEQKKSREKFFQEAESTPLSEDKLRERERDRERERERERRERERERKEKEKREKEEKEKEKKEDAIDPKELELLKQSYLGGKKEKKKIIKPSEKFKFVFDWDEGEDTSKDLNPLYSTKVDIKPQFGRGNFGGLEIKDSDDKKKSKMDDIDKPLRHWSEKTLEEMTPRDWRIFKEDNNVSTKGGNLPHPIRNWKEAGFRKEVLDALEKSGYKTPTPIQMQAIPVALQGRDVMGIAETGSGKTCAFVLPMLEYILKLPPMTPATELEGPYALIMAPTRELATQIEQETRKFAAPCGIRCQCVVGGTSIEEQALQLRKGVEVIIATPGRLVDLVDSRFLALNQCTYIVLDEADRMIDMGFEPQVNKILDAMPVTNLKSEDDSLAEQQENDAVRGRYRTTIMYSATMPTGVERLSRKYLRRPAYVIIGEVGKAVDRIKQNIEFIKDDGYKMKRVTQLLEEGPPPPIIIFVNHKKSADGIAKQLEKFGFRAVTLHSSKSQWQREAAIEGFKSGKYDILVATDVAGRGIDVKGVTHIINYDMPTSIENYTHRIGRTGRAGAEGLATSFVTNDDSAVFYDLKQMLTATNNQIPQELAQHPASSVKPGSEQAMKPRRDTIIYAKK